MDLQHINLTFLPKEMYAKVEPQDYIMLLSKVSLLGEPEVTANIYCKSRNLPITDTQNYSTDLR